MITATILFVALLVLPLVSLVLGVVFRLLGWAMRFTFSLLGIALIPVGIIAFLVFGAVALFPLGLLVLALTTTSEA